MNKILDLLLGMRAATKPPDIEDSLGKIQTEFLRIFGIVLPVLAAIGAVFMIYKLVQLGIKLSQSGDDPEERSKVIKGLVWWGVGLLLTIAAIATVPGIIYGALGVPIAGTPAT